MFESLLCSSGSAGTRACEGGGGDREGTLSWVPGLWDRRSPLSSVGRRRMLSGKRL